MLSAVANHPGRVPQNQVVAMTATGKKNPKNVFPNELSNTRDSCRATATKAMPIPYRTIGFCGTYLDSEEEIEWLACLAANRDTSCIKLKPATQCPTVLRMQRSCRLHDRGAQCRASSSETVD